MSHDHQHGHAHGESNIGVAFFLNLSFTVIEIIGGFWTNSFAILSDALHDLGDSLSLGLAWYLQKLSKQGRTPTFTYGYKRFNTLGAIITGTMLVGGSVFILTQAIPELFDPQPTNATGMIWLAVLGILVNGAAVFRLRKGGESLNEQLITWHLLEDVLGWVAVLIGSIVMYYFDLPWIDPALSIGITVFILYGVVGRLWKAGKVILQATPEGIDCARILRDLLATKGVEDAHHLHVWTLDGEYHLASVHLVVEGSRSLQELQHLKQTVKEQLHDHGIEHATLELETAEERASHGEAEV